MITVDFAREFALSLPETTEAPHFERTAFKVCGKIFATMLEKANTVNVLLTPATQDMFCLFDKGIIYPVPNKWGLKGFTTIELARVPEEMFKDALKTAYCGRAPKDLAERIKFE